MTLFVPLPPTDAQRVPGRAPRGRLHASASRDPSATHLRGGHTGLSQTTLAAHPQQLLRPGRVFDTQGRPFELHLLPVQWLHGSCTERNGGGNFR